LTASRGGPRGTHRQLVGAGGVERGPVRAPSSLRSPVLSGRALRALSGKGTPIQQRFTHPVKRST